MSFESQDRAIEDVLRSKYGDWVPCYELAALALQYCRAINTIRKRLRRAGDRERVENKTEWKNGKCRGSYRIVLTSDVLGITPANPKPLKSWEEWDRERSQSKPESSFELTPP